MTRSLLQMGRSRPIWALLAFTLGGLILPIGGCLHQQVSLPAPTPRTEATELGAFQTDNGLLYPPELWAAVGESEQAQFIRWRIGRTLDPRSAGWPRNAFTTYTAVTAESDETRAAYLLVSAGVTDRRFADWCRSRINDWAASAAATDDIDALWMADEVGRALDCPLGPLSPRETAVVDAAAAGNDVVPAWEAAAVRAHQVNPVSVVPLPAATNLRGPLDAARFLSLRATLEHKDVASAPELARTLAQSAAPSDDLVMMYLVAAHEAAGDPGLAASTAAAFDPRRILADGRVLETPRFDGSVGSTYRMLRRFAGRLDTVLSPEQRQRIDAALVAQHDRDPIFAVTSSAARALLSPSAVDAREARAEVAAALAAMDVEKGPLDSAKKSLAWASVAECASSLGVVVSFPGLTDAAVREWTSAPAARTATSMARFLLAAEAAGATTDDSRVRALTDRLEGYLASASPAKLDTSSIVPGALAVHRLRGRWVAPVAELRSLLQDRDGGCRGDFGGFIRESATPRSICNVDATLAADQLATEFTR